VGEGGRGKERRGGQLRPDASRLELVRCEGSQEIGEEETDEVDSHIRKEEPSNSMATLGGLGVSALEEMSLDRERRERNEREVLQDRRAWVDSLRDR